MRRAVTSLVAFLVGVGGALAAVNLGRAADERVEGEALGSIDFQPYCERHFGAHSLAVLTRPDAFGWRCTAVTNDIFTPHEVPTDEACAEQYGAPAYAEVSDTSWPYGWECFYGQRS